MPPDSSTPRERARYHAERMAEMIARVSAPPPQEAPPSVSYRPPSVPLQLTRH